MIYTLSQEPPTKPDLRQAEDALRFLAWLLWDHIEAAVPAAVAGLDYPDGLSSVERRTRREALEQERARLLTEREQLVDEVNGISRREGANIEMAHERETAARRAAEQARAERERLQRETREQAIVAAEAAVPTRGAAPSPYLQRERGGQP